MLEQQDLEHVLSFTSPLWDNLKGKRIFIAGGTGFFGKWLLESFAVANRDFNLQAELHVLSRNPKLFLKKHSAFSQNQNIIFHQGDVRDFVFPAGRFDYIIHAATDADNQFILKQPLSVIDTIVEGTRKILDFAQSCSASKVLYVSSGAVYGKQPPEISHIPERYSGAPDLSSPAATYGEAKRLAELLCAIYNRQLRINVIVARCFAFVGPYLPLDLHFAIGNFIQDGLKNKSIHVKGDGTTLRSYLYAADLAVWLWTILLKGMSGSTYNVGSDQEINIRDLGAKVCKAFDNKIDVVIHKKEVPGNIPDRYVPDIDLAKKELDLKCRIGIEEAIRRTIKFHQNKP